MDFRNIDFLVTGADGKNEREESGDDQKRSRTKDTKDTEGQSPF
jgi:hypothetical protein